MSTDLLSRALCQVKKLAHFAFIRSVSVSVEPSRVLVDEKFLVKVSGLKKQQKVTIDASILERRCRYSSFAHFVTGDDGTIDVSRHESVNGTYTGVHQMGLVWSMINEPGYKEKYRLIKKDVTTPQTIDFRVHDGHVGWEQIISPNPELVLASGKVDRWYLTEDVTPTPIREGRLRGMLMIPKGTGPFPAIVDMFGGIGGLNQFRGALLAARGFLVYCLPYFIYDDLPLTYEDLDISYFEEAVRYLSEHPLAFPGIGIIGASKGGEMSYLMADSCPQVRAVVNVNGAPFLTSFDIYRGKEVLFKGVVHQLTKEQEQQPIALYDKFAYTSEDFFQIQETNAKFLVFVSLDDKAVDPESHRYFYESLPDDKKRNVELVCYPGAGHLIDPPYAPLFYENTNPKHSCMSILTRDELQKTHHNWTTVMTPENPTITGRTVMTPENPTITGRTVMDNRGNAPYVGKTLIFGGRPLKHSIAQEDSWKRTLQHFRTHLLPRKSKS